MTESVARLCREYHPAELLGLGLEGTLRAYVREFARRHGLASRISTAGLEQPLDGEQELHLYRIVQEALTNVARHARAREVTVRLARRGQRLALSICDDGVGFTPGASEPHSLGLATMRRARRDHGCDAHDPEPPAPRDRGARRASADGEPRRKAVTPARTAAHG